MSKRENTQLVRVAKPQSTSPQPSLVDKAYLRSHILMDLANRYCSEYGHIRWTSVCTRGLYIKGGYQVLKVVIEESRSRLGSERVAIDSLVEDEEDSPLGAKEEANGALIVLPDGLRPIVYVWDIDLLRNVWDSRVNWIPAEDGPDGELRMLPITIIKACATDSFTFKSEFYDRLLAYGVEEGHA